MKFKSKLKKLSLNAMAFSLGSVAQSAASLLMLPMLTGVLTTSEYGVFTLVTMVSVVASAVFNCGMSSSLQKYYLKTNEVDHKKVVFSTTLLIVLLGALLQMSVGWLTSEYLAERFLNDRAYSEIVILSLFGGCLAFINQHFNMYLRVIDKAVSSAALNIAASVLSVGALYFLLQGSVNPLSAPFIAIIFGQTVAALAFVMFFIRDVFVLKLERGSVALELIYFGMGIVVASFGQMLMDWVDRLIINEYMNVEAVGQYSAAFRVGMIVNVIIIVPFVQLWQPAMYRYRESPHISTIFNWALTSYTLLGCFAVIFSSIFGIDILKLLIRNAPPQGADAEVFMIAVFGMLIYGVTNIVSAGLLYTNKVYKISYVYYGLIIAKVLLGILLVPKYGLVGAIYSYLIISTLVPIFAYLLSKEVHRINFEWRFLFGIMAYAVIACTLIRNYLPLLNSGILFKIFVFTLFSILLAKITTKKIKQIPFYKF